MKKKWKSLRDQFSVEMTKVLKLQSANHQTQITSKWSHWDQLIFLKDVVKPRPSAGIGRVFRLNPDTNPVSPSTASTSTEVSQAPVIINNYLEESTETTKMEYYDEFKVGIDSSEDYESLDNQIEGNYNGLDNIPKLEDSEDGDLLFFKSIMPFVKKIPEHKKLSFRSQVQTLLEQFVYPNS